MEKMEIEKQNTVKKVRARRLSVSDDAGLDAYKPNGIPLINLETKSPLIWTIGVPVITLIVFILQIVQEGGIAQPNKNPMIGPSEEVSVIFGAKSYKEILEGSFWRYITANFVETNLVHFIISLFLVFACKDVEANSGFWRAFLVFSISGIYGYILSSLCAPWVISGGFSGALFGHIGLILSDIISTWRMHDSEKRKKLTFISIVSVTALLAGFTPFVDNFPHYGGIIMGFLASLMLIPNMSFNEFERRCHGITAFLAFPVLSILFTLTTIFVYRGTSSGDYICMWCKYLTCINIGNWCPVVEGGTAVIKNWN
jgi:membrane associated rhomboid family serine protease